MANVTKDWIKTFIETQDRAKVEAMIGRALVALFNKQTDTEKNADATNENNNVGFSGCDAKSGSLTAKSYMKHKRLLDWQINKWTRTTKNGYPRIARYAKQLNAIAEERELKVINRLKGVQ